MAGFGGDVMRSRLRSALTSQPPGTERQRARKRRRAFGLARMKLLGQPVAASSTTFMTHCQEIKHICSNCRGTESRDGESCAQGRC